MANRMTQGISGIGMKATQVSVGEPLAGMARPDGSEWATAHAAFTSLARELGGFADEQAQVEGARQGAIDGVKEGFKPTLSATVRGKAYDRSGEAAYLAQTQAGFQSDAMDLYQKHHNDPAGFQSAYDTLTKAYAARVGATGQHLVGDFTAKATNLGTSLRMKVADAFDSKQRDTARARLYETTQTYQTSLTKLAITDPDGPATMQQATSSLKALEGQIDGLVADGQLSEQEAVRQKREARATTLLTLYSARAEKMTDPAQIDTLRKQVRSDFAQNKMPMLDGEAFEKLDAGLAQLGKRRATEINAATTALEKKLDDYIDRNSKALTPTAGEFEALQDEAKRLGARGEAMLAQARGKLQIETMFRTADPIARAAILSRMEGQAKDGDYFSAIRAAESGGNDAARAGTSSAVGRYQFLAGTWNKLAADRPDLNLTRTDGGSDGRLDPAQQERAIRAFTEENESALRGAGLPVNNGSRYLAHFAGAGGAVAIMTAAKDASAESVLGSAAVNANPFLRTMSAGDVIAWAARKGGGGVSPEAASLLTYGRAAHERMTREETEDPLRAAERAGTIAGGQVAPVNFSGNADTIGQQMSARVMQADAVAQANNRAARYFRPEEKTVLGDTLKQGGAKALTVLDGIVKGAGARAPQALAELGEGAPELAHATMLALQTGDNTLQKRAAEALAARQVKGAAPIRPSDAELEGAMKEVAGGALRGLDLAQRARIKQTAALVYEREAAQRGADKTDYPLLKELVESAAGRTRINGKEYGGFADHKPAGFWTSSVRVQVPPDVRPDQFSQVLRALTDEDLKKLPDPPVDPRGAILSVRDLLTFAPHGGRGGYRFGNVDSASNEIAPVKSKSGGIFFLPWDRLAPDLKKRVPDAFR